MTSGYFAADWPAPHRVQTLVSTRRGGVSGGPFTSNNLGDHVGDNPDHVATNRQRLFEAATSINTVQWVRQVHGVRLVEAGADGQPEADGCWAREPAQACAILTADCLPVLLCNRAGTQVAAVHAGWRGLAAGILPRAIRVFSSAPAELMVYLGPAISQRHFRVGDEVRRAFLVARTPDLGDAYRLALRECFIAASDGGWRADLFAIARQQCAALGVEAVYGGADCTYTDRDRFYSFRRDGQTGRMASLIWLAP